MRRAKQNGEDKHRQKDDPGNYKVHVLATDEGKEKKYDENE